MFVGLTLFQITIVLQLYTRIIYLIVSGHACIDIKLTSLYYGTSWTYGPCSFPARIKNENTVTTKYVEKCCLSAEEYTLTCKDSEKMGWRGGYLEIQGHRHCHDFFIGYADRRKLSVRGRHWNNFLWNNSYLLPNIILLLYVLNYMYHVQF